MNKPQTPNIPRISIALGDDTFAIELTKNKYLEDIRALHGHCTVEYFDPSTERASDFAARAMTASLFSEIRAYCVLHAQSLSEKELTEIGMLLDYEIPEVYIFISAELDKKDSYGKKAASDKKVKEALKLKARAKDKSVSVQELSKPYPEKMAEWIMKQVPLFFNRQIGKTEADMLAETVEYGLIFSELQKIDMVLGPGERIDKEVIMEVLGVTREMTVYDLTAALGKRDLVAAIDILNSLFSAGFYAPLAVSAVFKHFWSLLRIRKFLQKNPNLLKQYNSGYNGQNAAAYEIGIACGMITEKTKGSIYPKIIKTGIINQSQTFSEKGLTEIIKLLQRFDVEVKTGRTEGDERDLQMLCYRIVRC